MMNSYQSFSNMSEQERKRTLEAMYRADGSGDGAVKAEDLTKHSGDIFEKGMDAMSNAKIGETQKIFGIKVDSGIAGFLTSIYSNASHIIFNSLSTKTYDNAISVSQKLGADAGKQKRIAAASTVAVAVALKAGKNISELWNGVQSGRQERKVMAGRIAPVLDEIKGHHSAAALNRVRESDNEVIYAHRDRLRRRARRTNLNGLTGLVLEALPNLALDFTLFKGMWGGLSAAQARGEHQAKEAAAAANPGMGAGQNLLGVVVNTSTGPLSSRIKETNDHKLRMTLQPYSALEMILELEKQVESDPKSHGYQLPKNYHQPNSFRESLPLEKYIAKICVQHQRDMAAINEEHSEIREALQDDLLAAVKPVANAIRKGDMSAMSLIRLVGEGKIIKKHGRAIADADDISALLEKDAPKLVKTPRVDPVEFYKDSQYTRAEMKAAFNSLDGEQKRKFAVRQPDSILEDIGVSKETIKSYHAATEKSKDYDRSLAEELMGVAHGKSDKELKEQGLASSEIKRLHQAVEKVEHEGEKAIHDLKGSPTNPHGIEQLLTNIAVPQLAKGDKAYFGKVIEQGHTALESLDSGSKDEDYEEHAEGHGHHQAREKMRSAHAHGHHAEME
jgi:hypothetical protein